MNNSKRFAVFFRIRQPIDKEWIVDALNGNAHYAYTFGTLHEAIDGYNSLSERGAFDDCDYGVFKLSNDEEWKKVRLTYDKDRRRFIPFDNR